MLVAVDLLRCFTRTMVIYNQSGRHFLQISERRLPITLTDHPPPHLCCLITESERKEFPSDLEFPWHFAATACVCWFIPAKTNKQLKESVGLVLPACLPCTRVTKRTTQLYVVNDTCRPLKLKSGQHIAIITPTEDPYLSDEVRIHTLPGSLASSYT